MQWMSVLIAISLFGLDSCRFHQRDRIRSLRRINQRFDVKQANFPRIAFHQFLQKLDHFNPSETKVWSQVYKRYDQRYRGGNPIFLIILAKEAGYADSFLGLSSWIEYAQHFNAMAIFIHHRYYGGSILTEDLRVENLKYLNTEQALADFAHFIEDFTKEEDLPHETKWIVFGCSESGSLAVWLRQKYPHLVHGAVASSSPLLAQVEFKDYYDLVSESLGHDDSSHACATITQKAMEVLRSMISNPNDQGEVEEMFNLCQPLSENSHAEIELFYSSIADHFADRVEYNLNIMDLSFNRVHEICNIMTDDTLGSEVRRLAYVVMTEDCFSLTKYYNEYIERLNVTNWMYEAKAIVSPHRQWMYQQCNEFGWLKTTSNASHSVFGDTSPSEPTIQLCADLFGPKFNLDHLRSAVARTNRLYGGLDNKASNVMYIQGSLDPWRHLGISQSSQKNVGTEIVEGGSHCDDIFRTGLTSQEAAEAIAFTKTYIDKWLRS